MNDRYVESVEMHPDGYPITKYKYIPPKISTFGTTTGAKYSIANRGAQKSNLAGTTVDHVGDKKSSVQRYKSSV
jgi:hypothetical protein